MCMYIDSRDAEEQKLREKDSVERANEIIFEG